MSKLDLNDISEIWSTNIALYNFGHSNKGLRAPIVTSGSWIDSREKSAHIIETWKVDLLFNLCDEQNPKIFIETEEIKFSAKFGREMKFLKNQGMFLSKTVNRGCEGINKGGKKFKYGLEYLTIPYPSE